MRNTQNSDKYNLVDLKKCLKHTIFQNFYFYHKVDSTMNKLKNLSSSEKKEGTIVIAEIQEKARGRFQRKWINKPTDSLCFSLLLKPKIYELKFLNMAISISICKSIEKLTKIDSEIKWPNDILLNNKKVSGTLIETELINEQVSSCVIGVGINVTLQSFNDPDLSNATSILIESGVYIDRNNLLIEILENLNTLYSDIQNGISLKNLWKQKLGTIGEKISVKQSNKIISGTAIDVTEEGDLIIQENTGKTIQLSSGEVTTNLDT
ncbi:MAG: biotin--[acetyl-CoA-carboxylase] ligase [SAR202 cluster bacterium]|nr:biotin--[acetyl-CoA-carboxylase] ligase [SAR202 cluster bacterium]